MAEFDTAFEALRATNTFTLRGTSLLVEIIPPEELKTKSGLILATHSDQKGGNSLNAHKIEYGKVLVVGQGTWDDEKREYVPLDVKEGHIVVLPQYSYQLMSTFPALTRPLSNKVAMVASSSILGFFDSEDGFNRAKNAMNNTVDY